LSKALTNFFFVSPLGGQQFKSIFFRLLSSLLTIQTCYILLALINQYGSSLVKMISNWVCLHYYIYYIHFICDIITQCKSGGNYLIFKT